MSWKCHVNHVLTKLISACYAIRTVTPHMAEETLRMIYFSYLHSVLSYGIILWGNSPHSISVFKMQKRIIRIMTRSTYRDSCRQLFKKLGILPLYSQYIFYLLLFVERNRDLYLTNQEIHGINTRYNTNLHFTTAKLTVFQRGASFVGIKLFNHLPINKKSM
jgi:hypothetical protein